jgi:RNA polymerase sigma-70 factor (ECF subfamily)
VLARITAPAIPPAVGHGMRETDEGRDMEAGLLSRVAASGDEASFRVLVDRHVGVLVGVARRLLGDGSEAEDIAQEAFMRLWRSAGDLDIGAAGVRPWLMRVATNLCLDRLRARRRVDVEDGVPETPVAANQSHGLEASELATRVEEALASLPDRQRTALTLFHYEGLSQVEVGKILDVSAEAVESLLARARRTLRGNLADEWRELLPDRDD